MFAGLNADYYGPPRPGESYSAFNAFMNNQVVVGASGVVVGAMIAGPVGAIVGGVGGWLMSGPRTRNKPKVQGG